MLVVAMDSKVPTFRSGMYAEYKAHRPPMPDDMPAQIDRIEQILETMNIPVLRVDGFEADDVMGTLAKKAAGDGIDVYLCSKDKDFLQLLDEHVRAFDMKSGLEFGPERMQKEMKMSPEQFLDVLALQGDASDNVPGVPDVGPMTALAWIQQYGSLDNLYRHADEITGKRGENLRASKDQAYLSKKLVTIDCGVPVDIDYDKFTLENPDEAGLRKLFDELGFSRLLAQLGLSTGQGSRTDKTAKPSDAHEPASVKTVEHDYQLIETDRKLDKLAAELKEQKLFAIDTETTSVHPVSAELVGISVSWQPGRAFYIPVKGPMGSKHLSVGQVRAKLGPILAEAKTKKVGQNIKFDMIVLSGAEMPLAGVYFDTMVASYCIDPLRKSHSMESIALSLLNYRCVPISALIGKGKNQLTFDMVDIAAAAEYAAEDADITLRLHNCLRARLEKQPDIKKLFEEVEMPLVSVLAAMEYNGVYLDVALLNTMSGELAEAVEKLKEEIYKSAGTTFNIDSPKQLGEVLFDNLGLEPVRLGKTGRSTDAAVLEQLAEEHPVVNLIGRYRQLTKLQNTYVDKLGLLINPKTRRVHASFNQTVTATGRLSSSDPNLQNIPIRTDIGAKIRSAFVPEKKSDCILSADYSQIELRLLAHFSRDEALLKAFAEDRDIHRFVASQVYDCPIDEVTSEMRSRCKAVNFGIIYGQGAFGLSQTTGLSVAEAKKFIDDYFARYSSIREFMDGIVEEARRNGYAETILGRRRKILNLGSKNTNKRNQARRLAINTVVQGSAADLIKVAMINIQRKIETEDLPVRMILQVHDELVFELPAAEADTHARWIADEMTSAIELDVPLKVDISHGPSWLAGK